MTGTSLKMLGMPPASGLVCGAYCVIQTRNL